MQLQVLVNIFTKIYHYLVIFYFLITSPLKYGDNTEDTQVLFALLLLQTRGNSIKFIW